MTRTHTKLGPVRGICLILALIGNLTTVPALWQPMPTHVAGCQAVTT